MRRRKALIRFSSEMEKVLRENDYKDGWDGCTREYLFYALQREVFELFEVLKPNQHHTIFGNPEINPEKVIKECCDVANFAMMIADNQPLEPTADHRADT